MSVLAALLVAVGTADLGRSLLDQSGAGRTASRGIATTLGIAVLLAVAALAGLLTGPGAWLVALAAATIAAWVIGSDIAASAPRGHVLALLTLGLGIVAQLALSGWAPQAGGALGQWLDWANLPWSPDPERALLISGLALVQLSTGNLLVRLVLISTDAMAAAPTRPQGPAGAAQPSTELKGGRLLGPLERLVILGLGLSGQATAAGLVVAAKGLIRWPELSAHSRAGGSHIDKVTEYFLVGSFVSWLVALSALVLAW